jgi:hypothetical protein
MMLPVQGVDGTDCCGMGHTDVVALLIRTQRRVELTLRRPSANRAQQQQQPQQQQQQQQQHEEVDEVAAYASAMYEPRAAAPGAHSSHAQTRMQPGWHVFRFLVLVLGLFSFSS